MARGKASLTIKKMVTKPIISDQSPIIHKSSLIVMIERKYILKYLSRKLKRKKNMSKENGYMKI